MQTMKIKVDDMGDGFFVDSSGNTYIVDYDLVIDHDKENWKAYRISSYDESGEVIEIETID